jgi:hypothetical protein
MVDQPKPSDKKLSIPLPFEEAIKVVLEADPKRIPPAPKKPPKESDEKDLAFLLAKKPLGTSEDR